MLGLVIFFVADMDDMNSFALFIGRGQGKRGFV